jgi:hypothetical protein
MRSRILVGAFVLVGVLVAGSVSTNIQANPAVKWAAVNLDEPTLIQGAFVSGPVLFEHDDGRMARGEPCTVIYRFAPGKGPREEIASFHCKPRWGVAVDNVKFALSTKRDPNGHCVLLEYQFPGDAEAHGVPTASR